MLMLAYANAFSSIDFISTCFIEYFKRIMHLCMWNNIFIEDVSSIMYSIRRFMIELIRNLSLIYVSICHVTELSICIFVVVFISFLMVTSHLQNYFISISMRFGVSTNVIGLNLSISTIFYSLLI